MFDNQSGVMSLLCRQRNSMLMQMQRPNGIQCAADDLDRSHPSMFRRPSPIIHRQVCVWALTTTCRFPKQAGSVWLAVLVLCLYTSWMLVCMASSVCMV